MQFVEEAIIDQVIEELEQAPDTIEALIEDMNAQQPALMPFLLGANAEPFNEQEQSLMTYLLLVIWKAHTQANGQGELIEPEALEEAEEQNWLLLEQLPAGVKRFHDRLDVLFEHSEQEDLLAFLEDFLVEDEEGGEEDMPGITREAREPIFVLLKTVIDCLG